MALTADSLDGFLPLLATSDTKSKLTIANNLINYLAEPESSIECSDIGQFIDSLIPWMQSSNNKVSQAGIDAMAYVVDRMGADFRPYVATVLPPIIDRLGDSKEVVREKAQLLLLRLAEREVLTPQALLERLTPAFAHKNGKIREEVLQCLQRTLTEHGAAQLSVSRLVPHVVKLLSDPMATVRDTALATLVEVYRHVGERLRHDLQKKHSLPASKVPVLMARFDELRAAGDLLPSALAADGPRAIGESSVDEVDRAAPRRASSVPRRSAPTVTATPAASRSFAAAPSTGSSVAGQAGAVDEETFRRAFADVVPATIFSARELDEQLAAARDALGDSSKDWNKRVDAMRRLRTLVAAAVAAGGALEEALLGSLRPLEGPLAAAARDLRSQLVREACISVAYVSEVLRVRADRFAEALLPTLLSLIQNSAKVMATAGAVAARFLLRNTPAPRLIPPLCRELASSKSRDIRRACADLLALALSSWPPHALERHAALLQDGVRRGVADADPEARLSARKAYWAFRSHFPEMADQLLQSLDASYRRALNGEALSASSSSNSLQTQAHGTGGRYGGAARLRSTGSAQGNVYESDHFELMQEGRKSLKCLKVCQPTVCEKPYSHSNYESPPRVIPQRMTKSLSPCRLEYLRRLSYGALCSDVSPQQVLPLSPSYSKPLEVPVHNLTKPLTPARLVFLKNLPSITFREARPSGPADYIKPLHHEYIPPRSILRPPRPQCPENLGIQILVKSVSFEDGSTENLHQGAGAGPQLHRTPSLPRQSRSGIPVLAKGGELADGPGSGRRAAGAGVGVRSSSAIDLQAAQRAKARAQYAALARHKVGSGASLPRPRKSSDAGLGSAAASAAAAAAAASPERVGRTRCRVAGVSQSQPSSRSGSPSSRLSYATYSARLEAARGGGDVTDSGGRPRRLTGIPRSTGASREASRETSPSRFASGTFSGSFAQPFGSKLRGRSLAGLERPTARPVMAQKILQQSREAESAIADALNCDSPESGDFSRTVHGRKRLFDDHSDDSETSSVCSERSFDSFRRPSDSFSWSGSQQRLYRESLETSFPDISEIIANCASTHWSDRKEGLVGLQVFLQNGQLLRPSELQRVTEIFTKMFMDSHTKVFSLFLDTLLELLQAHRADLHDWLYVLLTRLLNKLGTDLLNSIHAKIQRVLAQVREAFPAELQLACVMRFLTDATQTPNARVRAATLAHLSALCAACGDPSAVPTRSPAPQALARIVALADGRHSKQPAEVRRAAHGALVALFDLAAPQVAMMLAELPREYQEIAAPMLQSHLRRSSGASGTGVSGGTGGSPPSPGRASPAGALGSPGTPLAPRPTRADDDELNPEEVYRSLRRTTAEIQSYPFGDAGSGGGGGVVGGTATSVGSTKLPDRDRDTTSQDSGISQMSTGAGDKMDALEEHFEALSLTRNNSGRSSSLSSPTHRHNSLQDYNGIDADSLGHTENGFLTRESQEDSEALRKALEVVRPQDNLGASEVTLSNSSERKQAFIALQRLAKEANSSVINEHFRVLLRVLLELLGRPDEPRRDYVLGVLSELLLRRDVAVGFHNYVELLVLKVLEAYKDGNKDVMRMGEVCSASVGATLPPDTVIKVLNPLITTGDYPVNLGAIKMLMKVVESRPKEQLEPHLGDVMPALIKAYNNEESPVRKSAVFCMVALHNVLGEEALQPHLAKLSGSKLKLLHLYIRRAQAGTGSGGGGGGGGSGSSGNASAPTSPKNNQAP